MHQETTGHPFLARAHKQPTANPSLQTPSFLTATPDHAPMPPLTMPQSLRGPSLPRPSRPFPRSITFPSLLLSQSCHHFPHPRAQGAASGPQVPLQAPPPSRIGLRSRPSNSDHFLPQGEHPLPRGIGPALRSRRRGLPAGAGSRLPRQRSARDAFGAWAGEWGDCAERVKGAARAAFQAGLAEDAARKCRAPPAEFNHGCRGVHV